MKKKLSRLFVKIGLLAVLAFSFPLTQAPASYCFATDDPPTQDGSKDRPKQGPDKKEQQQKPAETNPLLLLIYWLLS
jgi:hypothetical protein